MSEVWGRWRGEGTFGDDSHANQYEQQVEPSAVPRGGSGGG